MCAFRFLFLSPDENDLHTSCLLQHFDVCFDVEESLACGLWEPTNYEATSFESQRACTVSSRVCVCSTYTMTFFKRRSLVLRWFFAFAWFVAGSLCFVLGPGCLGVLLSSTSPRPACLPSASPPRLSFSARLFFIVGLCKRLPSNSPTRRLAGWLMSFKKA